MSHMGHADRNLEAGVDKRGKHSRAPCGARGLKSDLIALQAVTAKRRALRGARELKDMVVARFALKLYLR